MITEGGGRGQMTVFKISDTEKVGKGKGKGRGVGGGGEKLRRVPVTVQRPLQTSRVPAPPNIPRRLCMRPLLLICGGASLESLNRASSSSALRLSAPYIHHNISSPTLYVLLLHDT